MGARIVQNVGFKYLHVMCDVHCADTYVLLKQVHEKVLAAMVHTERRALPCLIKEFLKHVLSHRVVALH